MHQQIYRYEKARQYSSKNKFVLFVVKISLSCLIPVSFLITFFAKKNPETLEKYFSLGFYKHYTRFVSTISSIAKISFAEIFIVLFTLFCIVIITFFVINMMKQKNKRLNIIINFLLTITSIIGVLLFIFTFSCGLNYYRQPFTYYSDLEMKEMPTSSLKELSTYLMTRANELRTELSENENGVYSSTYSNKELSTMANTYYSKMASNYNKDIFYPAKNAYPKPVVLSVLMSYAQISGIYFPFTSEANVNLNVEDFTIPATMCHEITHVSGFMREDEANFIAYLACKNSENPDFEYSGTMLALVYSMNALYANDVEAHTEVNEIMSDGVRNDFAANSVYHQKYDTKIGTISTAVNDAYLKINSQHDGVKSYGRVVDLLLADYFANPPTLK